MLIAFTVLTVMLGGLLRAMGGSVALSAQSQDLAVAVEAARTTMEELQAQDLATVFAAYGQSAGADPGDGFEVVGLQALPDDADGLVGQVLFPVDPKDPAVLCETVSDFPGMPRDLNLDGDSTDADVTADCVLLPVVVRLEWRGPGGAPQTYELRSLLCGL